jgi:uncharacterized membrane protein
MLEALLALTAAALFTGAAWYISLAEHPARMGLSDSAALAQWKPSYHRATLMQAGLAIVSAVFGFWAWAQWRDPLLLAGALLILSVVPFTLIVIMPTNKKLGAIPTKQARPKGGAGAVRGFPEHEARPLLERWGRLHWVRNLLSAAALAAFLLALSRWA